MRCWRHFKHGKHLPQKRRQKSCHAWNYYYRFEAKSISYPFLCGLIFLEKKGHVIHDTMRELICTLTYPFVCAFSPSPKANFYFDNKKKKQKWNHISLSCNLQWDSDFKVHADWWISKRIFLKEQWLFRNAFMQLK